MGDQFHVLWKKLFSGMPEKYYQLLTATSFESQNEWRELVLLLTTIETYFMRDKGQFALLKTVIFPELIELKRNLHKTLGIQPIALTSTIYRSHHIRKLPATQRQKVKDRSKEKNSAFYPLPST